MIVIPPSSWNPGFFLCFCSLFSVKKWTSFLEMIIPSGRSWETKTDLFSISKSLFRSQWAGLDSRWTATERRAGNSVVGRILSVRSLTI